MVNFPEPRTRFPDTAFTDGQWEEGYERGWKTGVEHGKDQGFGQGVVLGPGAAAVVWLAWQWLG